MNKSDSDYDNVGWWHEQIGSDFIRVLVDNMIKWDPISWEYWQTTWTVTRNDYKYKMYETLRILWMRPYIVSIQSNGPLPETRRAKENWEFNLGLYEKDLFKFVISLMMTIKLLNHLVLKFQLKRTWVLIYSRDALQTICGDVQSFSWTGSFCIVQ